MTSLPEPYYTDESCTIYCGDCLEILPLLPKFDLALTDPPFGVGNFVQVTGKLRGKGSAIGKKVTWNNSPPCEDFFQILSEKSTHRIIWGANFFNCFEDKGGAIIWDKCQPMPNFSKADIASCTYFQKTEIVTIPWTNFNVSHRAESEHPCERPTELYRWCIQYIPNCCTILDPYMGSGTTLRAAKDLGLKATGIEINPEYCEMAKTRLAQMVLPL